MNAKDLKLCLKTARECIRKEEYENATKHCQVILDHEPSNYNALTFLAVANENIGHKQTALQLYQSAIAIDRKQMLAWQGLASFYEKNMETEYEDGLIEAYKELMVNLESDKMKYEKVCLKLADVYKCRNQPDLALRLYEEIDEWDGVRSCEFLHKLISAAEAIETLSSTSQQVLLKAYRTLLDTQPQNDNDMVSKYMRLLSLVADPETTTSECERLREALSHLSRPVEYLAQTEMERLLGTPFAVSPVLRDLHSDLSSRDSHSPLLIILDGYKSLCDGDLLVAQTTLRRGLKESEMPVYGYVYLAQVENRLHQYVEAEKVCNKGMESAVRGGGVIDTPSVSTQQSLTLELCYSLYGQETDESQRKADDLISSVVNGDLLSQAILLRVYLQLSQGLILQVQELLDKEIIEKHHNLIIQGWMLHLQGDNSQAAQILARGIEVYENIQCDRFHAMFRLAYVYWCLAKQSHPKADESCFKTLLKAAKLDPYDSSAFLYLGRFYEDMKDDVEKAVKCYKKAYNLNRSSDECCVTLCDALFSLNMLDELKELLKIVVHDSTINCNKWAWLRMGLLHLRQRDYGAAISSLQSALKFDMSNSHVWETLGEAYYRRGSFTAALKTFTKALELNPDSVYSRYQIALTRKTLGLYSDALNDYNALLLTHPTYVPALKGLADTHLLLAKQYITKLMDGRATSHCQSAIVHLSLAVKQRPEMSCLWKLLADACTITYPMHDCRLSLPVSLVDGANDGSSELNHKDILQFGARCYSHAIRLHSECASLWYDLAVNYFYQSRLAVDNVTESGSYANMSLKLLYKVVSTCPSVHTYWTALGTVAASPAIHNQRLAQHCFIKSIQADSNNVIAWSHLGIMYLKAGDNQLAHEAFNLAQSIDPAYVIAWIGQALIAESVGHEDAMDLFRHASELSNHVEGLLKYSHWVCTTVLDVANRASDSYNFNIIDMSAIPAAEAAMSKYLDRIKTNAVAYNMYGLVQERQQLYQPALRAYKRAMDILVEKGDNRAHTVAAATNYARLLGHTAEADKGRQLYQAGGLMSGVSDLNDLVAMALVMYRARDYLSSYQAYEAAVSQSGLSDTYKSRVYTAMGMVSYAYGELNAAQSEFITSSQCHPSSSAGLICLASLAVLRGDITLTEVTLSTIDEVASDDKLVEKKLPLHLKLGTLKDDVDVVMTNVLNALENMPPNNTTLLTLISNFILQYPHFASLIVALLQQISIPGVEKNVATGSYCHLPSDDLLRVAQKAYHSNPTSVFNYVVLISCIHSHMMSPSHDPGNNLNQLLSSLISSVYTVYPRDSITTHMSAYITALNMVTLLQSDRPREACTLLTQAESRSEDWREQFGVIIDRMRHSTYSNLYDVITAWVKDLPTLDA